MRYILAFILLFVFASPSFGKCLVLGDSIAYGTASYFPQCKHDAKVGIDTAEIARRASKYRGHLDNVIISSGTNDRNAHYKNTAHNLGVTEGYFLGVRQIWIIPQEAVPDRLVRSVAGNNSVKPVPGRGSLMARLHPASYAAVARQIRTKFGKIH